MPPKTSFATAIEKLHADMETHISAALKNEYNEGYDKGYSEKVGATKELQDATLAAMNAKIAADAFAGDMARMKEKVQEMKTVEDHLLHAGKLLRATAHVGCMGKDNAACAAAKQLETEALKPVDCALSDWSQFTACAGGKQTRTRTILKHPRNGGTACGALTEEQSCTDTTM